MMGEGYRDGGELGATNQLGPPGDGAGALGNKVGGNTWSRRWTGDGAGGAGGQTLSNRSPYAACCMILAIR